MKPDRFLLTLLGAIGLLAITAILLFFIRQNSQTYGTENTPEGLLRNYVLALNQEDYAKAYSYLQENETKPDFAQFREKLTTRKEPIKRAAIKIISVDISGEEAKIQVIITQEGLDPFDGRFSSDQTISLLFQDEHWKLTKMPYPFGY